MQLRQILIRTLEIIFASGLFVSGCSVFDGPAAGVLSPVGGNTITVSCLADQLSLSANGQSLLVVQDNLFQEGMVSLSLLTRAGRAEIHFDRFVLWSQ